MKVHRFYVGDNLELDRKIWINDQDLLHQWTRVLRFKPEQKIILFNNLKEERLYSIDRIEPKAVHLSLVTDMVAKTSSNEVYLCFSLLKKDNTALILQKATELGVRHFLPLLTDRTEKTGFNLPRANKIVIEAAEQCGRADIPQLREPISLESAIKELKDKLNIRIAQQGTPEQTQNTEFSVSPVAVFVGPEGGWSEKEKKLFTNNDLSHISLSQFTLRAETANIAAAALFCR